MVYLLFILFTYVSWTYIHELAHLLALKRYKEVKSWSIKPFPHKHPRLGFVFGSVSYDYEGGLTSYQLGVISIAPRIPGALGSLLFCIDTGNLYWDIFFAGALIDTLRGSLPLSETSDICRYSRGFNLPVFDLALAQLSFVCLMLYLKLMSVV